MTIINLEQYVAIRSDSAECPECEGALILLCEKGQLAKLQSYYICNCGFLAAVGGDKICGAVSDD